MTAVPEPDGHGFGRAQPVASAFDDDHVGLVQDAVHVCGCAGRVREDSSS